HVSSPMLRYRYERRPLHDRFNVAKKRFICNRGATYPDRWREEVWISSKERCPGRAGTRSLRPSAGRENAPKARPFVTPPPWGASVAVAALPAAVCRQRANATATSSAIIGRVTTSETPAETSASRSNASVGSEATRIGSFGATACSNAGSRLILAG